MDCTIDDQQVVDSGGRVIDGAVTSKLYRGSLRLDDATWKVDNITVVSNTEGIAGCAG
jgi:hypothetical protein